MSLPTSTRQWTVVSYPEGQVNPKQVFKMTTAPLRELKNNEVLVKQIYLSLDPAMRAVTLNPKQRGYAPAIALGNVMTGGAIGQVIASKNPAWKVGDRLNSTIGWSEYGILEPREPMRILRGVPSPLAMSVLGGTGLTAFFGVLDILKPKPGDVAVVSGAAGATGSIAAQLLKIMGCKVIAIAGTKEKCDWLVKELGMDAALNYKDPQDVLLKQLKDLTPDFINLYFDNTGGFILSSVVDRIALGGKIALCGAISLYNAIDPKYPINTLTLVTQRASMSGFLVSDYAKQFPEARDKMSEWIKEGKLKGEQTIVKGFDSVPEHFLKLFDGSNVGKLMVHVGEEGAEAKL